MTVVERQGVAIDSVRLGWAEILGIRVLDTPTVDVADYSGRHRLVLLDITSEAQQRLSAERSWWQRGLAAANTGITGHPSFALPTDQGVDPEAFAAWLGRLHASYTNRPPPG